MKRPKWRGYCQEHAVVVNSWPSVIQIAEHGIARILR